MEKMRKMVRWRGWEVVLMLCHLLLATRAISQKHGNPANEIVDLINENRTAAKLLQLNNSPGNGCMALQFVEACKGNCTANNTLHCSPSEDDLTEIFAPNCGIELPTFGLITGHILGCHHKHLNPSEAFLQ
ncbi:hypothetical protein MLD38_037452 [Melastoma candidum]|uniref:Uncharacterized protein n=1 Tax=Melastoma candidum TaxID=119954 RepID=A0ACB9LPL3_9MYRT|nr:hypothetical protein MLD38_037452 [Melastoma candidum]